MTGRRENAAAFLLRVLLAVPRKLARACRSKHGPIMGEVTLAGRTWRVEVAMSAHERYVGLGGRDRLEPGTGMLFVYPSPGETEFTMRGCLVPLDIAFLSADRRVVSMDTMTVERDRAGRKPYCPGAPAQFILEVPAGELAEAGVTVGTRATFSRTIPLALLADPRPLTNG
jgi:uncharacterized membrane protein (UPF0127 family)